MTDDHDALQETAWIEVIRKMEEVYSDLIQYEIELEEKNTALEEAQRFITSVLSSVSDILLVCDPKGIILQVNLAFLKLTDLAEADIVGRPVGDLLAEGSRLAAKRLGGEAERYALHVKGIEMVSFEPRTQTNLALGYATAPIGPRYDICEHDWDFDTVTGWDHTLKFSRTLGILERIPMQHTGKDKVRNYKALNTIWSACDTLDLCIFASAPTRLLSLENIAALIGAVTGWETSL